MAWRETRAAPGKFAFLVTAVALGTGALTAVTGFNESVRVTLAREARTLMAADVSIRLPLRPLDADLQYIDSLASQGVQVTRVTETVSMASAGRQAPALVSIKGADFSQYPFYGRLELDPPGARLDESSVAASDDLLIRLKIRLGDAIRVGAGEYKIVARIAAEPDRMTTGFTLGPRVLFTREGLDRSQIVTPVSRITERVLLKLPDGADIEQVRHELETKFARRARISDYTETNPTLTRALNRATRFLSMVSLIALIVGGLGVGAAMQSHLRQKINNIAFMKCVGGRSETIVSIYLVQALWLGLAGSAAGAVLGAFAQAAFARLVANYFDVEVILVWPVAAMLKGTVVGVLTAILFTLPALLSVRNVRPALLLRRDFSDDSHAPVDRGALVAAVVVVVGLWAIAVWVGSSIVYASVFAGSLIGSLLFLGLCGAGLLRLLKAVSRRGVIRRRRAWRHGIANLYRPGAHTAATLASVGIGVMFTLSVYFVQYSLVDEIRLTAPPDAPNVFLINITERERAGVTRIIESDPAVWNRQPLAPAVSAQLLSVDGTPLERIPLADGARRFLNTQFVLTWADVMPPATQILDGAWWRPPVNEPMVSVQESAAEALGVKVGSVIEWTAFGKTIRARTANIRRTDGVRIGANNQFILSPGALDGFGTVYYGAIRVDPSEIGRLQTVIFESFPTVTVVNAADILSVVQEVVDRTSLAVRFVGGFAILGGLIVLASSVAGARYRRMREAAILKTAGATRGALIRIFSAEFAVIGLTAGVVGSILGTALSAVLVGELLDAPYRFMWFPAAVATAGAAALTVATGWIASYGVLSRKPLEILRSVDG